jgi:Domain of unknown function (DUF4136)
MIKKIAIYSLLLIFIAACSSGPNMYSSEKKNGIDFSKYKTYAFLPTKDTSFAKIVNKQKLVAALTEEGFRILDSKGMKYDTIKPDCLFRYSLVMKKDYSVSRDQEVTYSPYIETANLPNQPKIYYFSSDNKPEVYNGNAQLSSFRDGTMVIDMIDHSTNEVVWRSTAVARKEESQLMDLKSTVQVILPNMFHKFPIKK